jgi:hypothetical protein
MAQSYVGKRPISKGIGAVIHRFVWRFLPSLHAPDDGAEEANPAATAQYELPILPQSGLIPFAGTRDALPMMLRSQTTNRDERK